MTSIHQFTPVTSLGDGVTGSLLFIRKLLRSLGYCSEIYATSTPRELSHEVLPLHEFDSSECDLLFVHHSMGHDAENWIRSLSCPRLIVYHNITPSKYFSPHTEEYYYAIKGRHQLKYWQELFSGAISISPYNLTELTDNGYTNSVVLPLVVDMSRFDGIPASLPPEWNLSAKDTIILCVGRIADNKRQHLLVEAFFHLKKIMDDTSLRLVIVGSTTSHNYHHQVQARIQQLNLEDDITLTGKCSDAELRGLYQNSQLLWCASEHEGFCIPLIEANYFSLPVVAFSSSNIPDTLGKSGILIDGENPLVMASTTAEILKDKSLRERLVAAGENNLIRYQEDTLKKQLQTYLKRFDL